jgi:hypothetical protein
MSEIVLTEEQAKQLVGAVARVEVKDASGRVIGHLDPIPTPEFIAEMKRRAASPGPKYTATQIEARLEALNAERARAGPFDKAYLRDFLNQLEQSDPEKYGPAGTS